MSGSIDQLVLILGKRLVNNRITTEGAARVRALLAHLSGADLSRTVLGFCGGTSPKQPKPEALALFEEYHHQCAEGPAAPQPRDILFDTTSSNTIQNIENISKELVATKLVRKDEELRVKLVTSDYHLERIVKIQQQMDERGLLRILIAEAAKQGIQIKLPYEVPEHVGAAYPHSSPLGKLYRQVDRLTIYRVYLEGLVYNSFVDRPPSEVRPQPCDEAMQAINFIEDQINSGCQLSGRRPEPIRSALASLKLAISETPAEVPVDGIWEHLAFYDTGLTLLNRYLDPETLLNQKWW